MNTSKSSKSSAADEALIRGLAQLSTEPIQKPRSRRSDGGRPSSGERSDLLTQLDEKAGAPHPGHMASLRRARWIGAALLAPLLALAVLATSHVALRCSLTGAIMSESSCPLGADEESEKQPVGHASIAAPSCCERVILTIGKVPATASGRAPECPIPSATFAVAPFPSVVDLFAHRPHGRVLRAVQPLGIDAPPFLLKHSFLI